MSDEMIKAFLGVGVAVESLEFEKSFVRSGKSFFQGTSRGFEGLHFRGFRRHVIDHLRLGRSMIVSVFFRAVPGSIVNEVDIELRRMRKGIPHRKRHGHVIKDAIHLSGAILIFGCSRPLWSGGRRGQRGANCGGDAIGGHGARGPFGDAGLGIDEGDASGFVHEIHGAFDAVTRNEEEQTVGSNAEDDGVGETPLVVR